MFSLIEPYLNKILAERDWSWSVVCVLYVLAAWFVRSWFIGPVAAKVRALETPLIKRVEFAYLKRSIPGWALFFFPLAMIVLVWRKEVLPIQVKDEVLLLAGFSCFVLSVILHLQSYATAALGTLKSVDEEHEKIL